LLVGWLNYLGFGEGLPFEGLMSSNVIEVAAPAGTTTVSPVDSDSTAHIEKLLLDDL